MFKMVHFVVVFILLLNINHSESYSPSLSSFYNSNNQYGYMVVNGYKVRTKNNLNNIYKNNGYDEIGNYTFVDGEIAKISCISYNGVNLDMFFYDHVKELQEYTEIPGTKYKTASMALKLTKYHNKNSYFTCKINTGERYWVIRLDLYQRNTRLYVDTPRFKINDLTLRPLDIDGVKGDLKYLYVYYEDEVAAITSVADKKYYDVMDCVVYMTENDGLNVFQKQQIVPEFNLETELSKLHIKTTNTSVFCTVFATQWAVDQYNLKNITMSLSLQPYDGERSYFDPRIIGLSWSKVLQKYKRNENLGVIHYAYRGSEELTLTCTSTSGKHVNWTYDRYTAIVLPTEKQYLKTITRSFIMKATSNTTRLKCHTESSSTHLILKRIGLEDGNKSNLQEIIGSILAFLAILTVSFTIWSIVKLYKRKKKMEQLLENSHYENLPHHNEGPMVLPDQWRENCSHTTPSSQNITKMYATPIPKHLRPKQGILRNNQKEDGLIHKNENEYAEINYAKPFRVQFDDEEGQYAEIVAVEESVSANDNYDIFDKAAGSKNYTNVLVKAEVIKDVNNKPDRETQAFEEVNDKYADLDLKTNVNTILKNEIKNYVEVQHCKVDNKYENVFDSGRYENVHNKKEFVEPAYSEINK